MKTNLEKQGFVHVLYPKELRRVVEDSVHAWKQFCALNATEKQQYTYSSTSDGVGYEYKDGQGLRADKKENFDIALQGETYLRSRVQEGTIAHTFVAQAMHLANVIKPIVCDFAKDIEHTFDIGGLADEVAHSDGAYFVRFIHYFGNREIDEEMATAHTDQSGFTLHLFESDPGLQGLGYNGTWFPMDVSAGSTVIIPSMQLQLKSRGKLKATCHRVVANPTTIHHGRYAVVCFVQFRNTPKYNKAECGRLQEKVPGFNYTMSHDTFASLFK